MQESSWLKKFLILRHRFLFLSCIDKEGLFDEPTKETKKANRLFFETKQS